MAVGVTGVGIGVAVRFGSRFGGLSVGGGTGVAVAVGVALRLGGATLAVAMLRVGDAVNVGEGEAAAISVAVGRPPARVGVAPAGRVGLAVSMAGGGAEPWATVVGVAGSTGSSL